MTSAAKSYPKHIVEALDAYRIEALPIGFSDRLIERALSQSAADNSEDRSSGWRRLRKNSPWKRGGYVASGVVGFGLVSAAAAAALSLADIPVKIPIMSDLVESVLPVASAKSEPPPTPPIVATKSSAHTPAIETDAQPANETPKRWREMDRSEKRALLKERVAQNETRLQERRVKRGLPPLTETQLKKRRLAIRRALANPETRKPLVRRAVRRAAMERALNGPGQGTRSTPTQEQLREPAPESREPEKVAGENTLNSVQLIENKEKISEQQGLAKDDETSTEASVVPQRTVPNQLTPEQRQILRDRLPDSVKSHLKRATPAERRKILRDLRSKRKSLRNRSQARQRLRDIRNRTK